MKQKRKLVLVLIGLVGLVAVSHKLFTANLLAQEAKDTQGAGAQQGDSDNAVDPALERARREVRMLDDIYKGGVVVITESYVNDRETIPAGTAFKKLFAAAEKKGWHKVRLLDATGEPYNDENVAEDNFEKDAIKQLVQGKAWVESIETRKGTRHLRVATPVPVVFEKCIMCHDNYADLPAGRAIGALSYTIPIDGPLVVDRK